MDIDEVIHRTLDEAEEAVQTTYQEWHSTRHPGKTYEDGIRAFWDWLVGNTEEHPYPNLDPDLPVDEAQG